MTVLCGACSAENRDAAKFCKGCGRKIAQAWPQAAPAVLASGEAAVLLSPGSAPAPRAAPPAVSRAPAPPASPGPSLLAPTRPRIGNGRWIAALAIGLLLLVVLAAWWGHRNRSIAIDEPTPAAIGSSMASSSAPAEPTVPEAQAQPAIPPAPPAVIAEKLEPLASAAPETAKPAPKPRKAAKKQAEAPVAVVQETAPAAPAPTPEPVRPPSPQESCAGRNFIATAQCMAAQCARPEVAGHAQCEAVRRQQRIDEEKRNPTMAN